MNKQECCKILEIDSCMSKIDLNELFEKRISIRYAICNDNNINWGYMFMGATPSKFNIFDRLEIKQKLKSALTKKAKKILLDTNF